MPRMWLDTIAFSLLALFALAGFLRGALAAGLALACLLGAYGVATLGASGEAPGFARATGLPEVLGGPLLGAVLFVATYLVARIVSGAIVRAARNRRRHPRTALDRILGGCFGALRGGVYVLLLCVLALWLDALRDSARLDFLPGTAGSRAAAASAVVIEAGVLAVTDDAEPGSRFLARMAAHPADSLEGIEALVGDPRISALQQDPLFWAHVEDGSVDAALDRASFLAVQEDDGLRRRFAELGFVDGAAGERAEAFRAAMRSALESVGPRLRGLRNDPEVRALVEDPEIAARLRSGEAVGLLSDARFRGLVADVASRAR